MEELLTALLLFGPAGRLVGLAPDGDAVLQQLQRPTLLPVRRADLGAQTPHCSSDVCGVANGDSCGELPSPCWSPAASASRPRRPALLQGGREKEEKKVKRPENCSNFARLTELNHIIYRKICEIRNNLKSFLLGAQNHRGVLITITP